MTTSYKGRENEHDLGDGHSFSWFRDEEGVFGLIEHHPTTVEGAQYCGGYIAWRGERAKHELVAGGPGDEQHVTIVPSLQCTLCPSHGFIRDGRWISA